MKLDQWIKERVEEIRMREQYLSRLLEQILEQPYPCEPTWNAVVRR